MVNFAAGGLATPADCSLLMQLGVDGCFVGSGIFKSNNPKKRAHAMVNMKIVVSIVLKKIVLQFFFQGHNFNFVIHF